MKENINVHAIAKNKRNGPWQRDELILALNTYLEHAPQCPSKHSEEIRHLSDLLCRISNRSIVHNSKFRNANGVYMKLMNFRRFDPHFQKLGRTGLTRGNRLEEKVWNEYFHDRTGLRKEVERIMRAANNSG